MPLRMALPIVLLALLLAACTSSSSSPSTGLAPKSGAAATQGPQTGSAASPTAADAGAAAGGVRMVLGDGTSEARFRVKEQLANKPLPSEAVGTTKTVSGAVVFNADGAVVRDQSKIVVDLTTLKTDQNRRDNYIRQNTLETSAYPQAEMVVTEVRGLPWPLPKSGTHTFELAGDLTVHGVSRPVTWQTEATFDGDEVSGLATSRVTITEFGMELPKVALVLSIEDSVQLELAFDTRREAL